MVERGALRGREQEWNISEEELEEMVEADVLSKEASCVFFFIFFVYILPKTCYRQAQIAAFTNTDHQLSR